MLMRTRVGPLPVEITRPESAKFRRALLLLHGLWTGSWIWERFAAYLAHRGWESWAPDLLEGAPPFDDFDAVVGALERVARALPSPPIIVAHDTGAIGAAFLAARLAVPAVVAIAPLTAPADAASGPGLFAWPRFWATRVAGARVRPPRGAAARAFLGPAGAIHGARLVADAGPIFRALAASRVRLPPRVDSPGLVLSGDGDAVSPPEVGGRLAARLGWEAQVCRGRGHMGMIEPGWEEVADDAHRWIVQTLGAELLALLDEAEEP